MSYLNKCIETESRMVVPRGWGRGNSLFNEYRPLFCRMEKFWRLDGQDLTLLKWAFNGIFHIMYIALQFFKKHDKTQTKKKSQEVLTHVMHRCKQRVNALWRLAYKADKTGMLQRVLRDVLCETGVQWLYFTDCVTGFGASPLAWVLWCMEHCYPAATGLWEAGFLRRKEPKCTEGSIT